MTELNKRIVPCRFCNTLNRIPNVLKESQVPKCGKCKTQISAEKTVFEVGLSEMEKILLNSPIPVVVDFWAPWCGPCLGFAPTFQEFSKNRVSQVLCLKVNTETHNDVGSKFNIRSIPTLIIFENGKEKKRQSGAFSLGQLDNWVLVDSN